MQNIVYPMLKEQHRKSVEHIEIVRRDRIGISIEDRPNGKDKHKQENYKNSTLLDKYNLVYFLFCRMTSSILDSRHWNWN